MKEVMKKFFVTMVFVCMCVLGIHAEEPQKFSPEKFQAAMEQFIAHEACLTPEESAVFFPLFREMQHKQRNIFARIKKECSVKPVDAAECKKVVQKRDMYELELKSIQQTYHNKFFSVIPPSKVYDVIRAEDRFHRHAFRNWGHGGWMRPQGR